MAQTPPGGSVPVELMTACLEQADEAFWLVEADSGRLAYANGRARAWFGPDRFPAAAGPCTLPAGGAVMVSLQPAAGGRWLLGQARASAEPAVGRDALTGLANRFLFREWAAAALSAARRADAGVALLAIDLDRFGAVNATLGHEWGDNLLREAARRLAACTRDCDAVGRLGSDEFAVLLTQVPQVAEELSVLPARIAAALNAPYRLAGRELFVGATVGVAFFPADGESFDEVLRNASAALARAKETLKGGWEFFAADMNSIAARRLTLESELRLAHDRGEFVLHYQPKLSCADGAIVGFEALLRWRHPQRGLVAPGEFVGLLEDTGLIVPVGQWVLGEACRQLARWREAGFDGARVAVNLSVRQLRDPGLPDAVARALAEHAVPRGALELELTESLLMDNPEAAVGILAGLKAMGVRLSVDDFGTGYSSLSYLKRFPLDTVKIDRSFVRDIASDPDDAAITRAIISMAQGLKLGVVAEGVETEAQLALLVAAGCDQIQGYLFSPPCPADEITARLAEGWAIDRGLLAREAPRRTLLLVDDEPAILAALRRVLRGSGYRVLTATSGAEGFDLLARNAVDVIVSDHRMPRMTGVEFLRKAKALYPETVRLVLSGYTDLQSVTDAINEGAIYKFLTKPWDDDLLRANIDEAFRRKGLDDQNRALAHEVQVANTELARVNARLQEALQMQDRRLAVGRAAIEAAQEALRVLPVPLLGLDPDGLVVLANEAAGRHLPSLARVGALLDARAAPALAALLAGEGGEGDAELDGRPWRVCCRPLGGAAAEAGGWLLAFLGAAG